MVFSAVQPALLESRYLFLIQKIENANGAICFKINPTHDNGYISRGGDTGFGQINKVKRSPVHAK